jgi:hypothetical protein
VLAQQRVVRAHLVRAEGFPQVQIHYVEQLHRIARAGITTTRLLCDPVFLQNELKYRTRNNLGANPL